METMPEVDGGQLEWFLRAIQMRPTRARKAVVLALTGAGRPMTLAGIGRRIGGGAAHAATIYRTLEALVERGFARRVLPTRGPCRYEFCLYGQQDHCHPHFTCVECGATTCFREVEPAIELGTYGGYEVRRQHVQLEGVCPGCAREAKMKAEKRNRSNRSLRGLGRLRGF